MSNLSQPPQTTLYGRSFCTEPAPARSYTLLSNLPLSHRVALWQAIRLDEAAEGSATSSMVDDVFFVLLKAGRRAMGTGKAPSVVAILNTLNSLLSSQYRAALAAKLQVRCCGALAALWQYSDGSLLSRLCCLLAACCTILNGCVCMGVPDVRLGLRAGCRAHQAS